MSSRRLARSLLFMIAAAAPASAQTPGTVAFRNVNVVPMDAEHVLRSQTVIIRGGLIREVGPTDEVPVPGDALVVDGEGKYLMPGLADMHVHVRNEEDLLVYLANGVTTVLDMGGPRTALTWRDRTSNGSLPGPRILVSRFMDGPGGGGSVVETVEEARETVRSAAIDGYDYIKAYNALTTEQWDAIVEEADRAGLSIIGHGVRDPGLEHILQSGMDMVAHGEEYIYTLFRGCTAAARARIPEAIELTRRTDTYLIPNLSAYEIMALQWGKPPVVDSLLDQPQRRYLHPNFRRSWQGGHYTRRSGNIDTCLVFLRDLAKAFADAGLPLLLGTDSPGIPGMYPGYSIHDDARNLVIAGLTPYQILVAGTRAAGEFVERTRPGVEPFGVVEPGASADLVLLSSNPLDDVENWRDPDGVVARGSWWSRDRLRGALESMAAKFDAGSS